MLQLYVTSLDRVFLSEFLRHSCPTFLACTGLGSTNGQARVRQDSPLIGVAYNGAVPLSRDSAVHAVHAAYKKVILRVHPDKRGSEVDTQRLQAAKELWEKATTEKRTSHRAERQRPATSKRCLFLWCSCCFLICALQTERGQGRQIPHHAEESFSVSPLSPIDS